MCQLEWRVDWGEWIHVYVWLNHFSIHLKLPQHSESPISQYKIKSLKFGEKKRFEGLKKRKKERKEFWAKVTNSWGNQRNSTGKIILMHS